jgi:hypothetical protein
VLLGACVWWGGRWHAQDYYDLAPALTITRNQSVLQRQREEAAKLEEQARAAWQLHDRHAAGISSPAERMADKARIAELERQVAELKARR